MSKSLEQYQKDLARLRKFLTKKPATAKTIAKKLGISKVTVYRQLWALSLELPVHGRSKREGKTGPKSVFYST